eukprot:GHRR01027995.1.p1 GENE.GHRR01027995.1~~GHRR01027995.1.p1  ORF type:complete len:174 (+),score=47.31 GHRR01027995.1:397-918(+)
MFHPRLVKTCVPFWAVVLGASACGLVIMLIDLQLAAGGLLVVHRGVGLNCELCIAAAAVAAAACALTELQDTANWFPRRACVHRAACARLCTGGEYNSLNFRVIMSSGCWLRHIYMAAACCAGTTHTACAVAWPIQQAFLRLHVASIGLIMHSAAAAIRLLSLKLLVLTRWFV